MKPVTHTSEKEKEISEMQGSVANQSSQYELGCCMCGMFLGGSMHKSIVMCEHCGSFNADPSVDCAQPNVIRV